MLRSAGCSSRGTLPAVRTAHGSTLGRISRSIPPRHCSLLRKPSRLCASKHDSQKDEGAKHGSSKEGHRTEAELFALQKDMMYSQIHCINQEREAWLASQTALLTEIRELQQLHRDTVAGAYETFLVKERSYWQQQREEWEKKEAELKEQVAALQAGLRQQGTAYASQGAPQQAGSYPAAATQVADLLRAVAPASTAGQQAPAAVPAPVRTAHKPTPTTPATSANLPGFAADFAAAIAAVEHVDVLQDSQLSQFMTRQTAAPAPTAKPTPAAESPPPTPSTPGAQEHKGGPRGGAGAVVEPAGQPRRVLENTPIETVRAPQNGPPPMLRWGDNDIYWVGRLHAALASHGFYSSDEEEDDFVFGDSTQEAVAFFQASVSLPETGVATMETWEKLLQGTPEEFPLIGGSAPPAKDASPSTPEGGVVSSWHDDEDEIAWGRAGAQASAAVSQGKREGATGGGSATELGKNGASGASSSNGSGGSKSEGAEGNGAAAGGSVASSSSSSSSSSTEKVPRTQWPVVRDGDGGAEVHALQALLSRKGYRCCDDERQWWQCGSSTIEALLYFQACVGLPESGVCAEQTWRALLASEEDPEGEAAAPSDIDAVQDDEYNEDLSDMQGPAMSGRVYLLGEDRWSN